MKTYDAIIIGSGQAANPLGRALATAGWKTALIEREHVGGTCVNEGCSPTKTMVASARVAHLVRRAADYGVHTGSIEVDLGKVRDRKRDIVRRFRGGNERAIERTDGLDLVMGEARFTGPNTISVRAVSGGSVSGTTEPVTVGDEIETMTAPNIFINTGTRPLNLPIPGLESVPYLTSTSIMELDEVPKHLIVIGGGYIGLEFGQIFHRFGSRVSVIQRSDKLLGREDADVAEEVATILSEEGMAFHFNATTTQGKQTEDGSIQLSLEVSTADGEQERIIEGSHLLVAVGRQPNTDMLNLEAAGVQTDRRGNIVVNEKLETSAPGIYALGDVKGGPAFTHISYDDFRIVRANLIDKVSPPSMTSNRLLPYVAFIDPQLGRVGLSEQAALDAGYKIRVAKLPMQHVARAIETDETRGFMKAIVDEDTDQILGCAILGIEGGEVMSVLQMAMMGKVPYTAIKDGVFAHPTLAESLNNLFMTIDA